jgi:hypothetical protein
MSKPKTKLKPKSAPQKKSKRKPQKKRLGKSFSEMSSAELLEAAQRIVDANTEAIALAEGAVKTITKGLESLFARRVQRVPVSEHEPDDYEAEPEPMAETDLLRKVVQNLLKVGGVTHISKTGYIPPMQFEVVAVGNENVMVRRVR